MGRSSGARPSKAVRDEVLALRAQLATIPSDKWQRAQVIFDQMTALCGVAGPSNGRMNPRACGCCGHYGHTKQYCPINMTRKAQMTERELELDAARGYVVPTDLSECPFGPAQWEMIQRQNAIETRVEDAIARGLGCKAGRELTSASDVVDCDCSGCVEWKVFVGSQGAPSSMPGFSTA